VGLNLPETTPQIVLEDPSYGTGVFAHRRLGLCLLSGFFQQATGLGTLSAPCPADCFSPGSKQQNLASHTREELSDYCCQPAGGGLEKCKRDLPAGTIRYEFEKQCSYYTHTLVKELGLKCIPIRHFS